MYRRYKYLRYFYKMAQDRTKRGCLEIMIYEMNVVAINFLFVSNIGTRSGALNFFIVMWNNEKYAIWKNNRMGFVQSESKYW